MASETVPKPSIEEGPKVSSGGDVEKWFSNSSLRGFRIKCLPPEPFTGISAIDREETKNESKGKPDNCGCFPDAKDFSCSNPGYAGARGFISVNALAAMSLDTMAQLLSGEFSADVRPRDLARRVVFFAVTQLRSDFTAQRYFLNGISLPPEIGDNLPIFEPDGWEITYADWERRYNSAIWIQRLTDVFGGKTFNWRESMQCHNVRSEETIVAEDTASPNAGVGMGAAIEAEASLRVDDDTDNLEKLFSYICGVMRSNLTLLFHRTAIVCGVCLRLMSKEPSHLIKVLEGVDFGEKFLQRWGLNSAAGDKEVPPFPRLEGVSVKLFWALKKHLKRYRPALALAFYCQRQNDNSGMLDHLCVLRMEYAGIVPYLAAWGSFEIKSRNDVNRWLEGYDPNDRQSLMEELKNITLARVLYPRFSVGTPEDNSFLEEIWPGWSNDIPIEAISTKTILFPICRLLSHRFCPQFATSANPRLSYLLTKKKGQELNVQGLVKYRVNKFGPKFAEGLDDQWKRMDLQSTIKGYKRLLIDPSKPSAESIFPFGGIFSKKTLLSSLLTLDQYTAEETAFIIKELNLLETDEAQTSDC